MGVTIETVLTIDNSWKLTGWKELEKKLEKLFFEISKDLQSKIILRDTKFLTNSMPLLSFYEKEAGFFTHALINGFIKKKIIDAKSSTVSVVKKSELKNIELNLRLKENQRKKFGEKINLGELMKVAGGIDRQSAKRFFDEAIKRASR